MTLENVETGIFVADLFLSFNIGFLPKHDFSKAFLKKLVFFVYCCKRVKAGS